MTGFFTRLWFAASGVWMLLVLISMPDSGSPFRYWEVAALPPMAALFLGLVLRWIIRGS